MKTTAIYLDNFFSNGPVELIEECRYYKDVKLTGYKFKNHLCYSFFTELRWITDGLMYMTVDSKVLFSAIVENGKATVYIMRNGKRFEYRNFKVR